MNVESVMVVVPLMSYVLRPPPSLEALFPSKVVRVTVTVLAPSTAMPPPPPPPSLLLTVLSEMASEP